MVAPMPLQRDRRADGSSKDDGASSLDALSESGASREDHDEEEYESFDEEEEEEEKEEEEEMRRGPPVGSVSVDSGRLSRDIERDLRLDMAGPVHVRQQPHSAKLVPLGLDPAAAAAQHDGGAEKKFLATERSRSLRSVNEKRLSFRSGVLYGRTEEISTMRAAYERFEEAQLSTDDDGKNGESATLSSKEIVLLKGLSGVGKSALAEQLRFIRGVGRREMEQTDGEASIKPCLGSPSSWSSPFFFRGKFDKIRSHQPYSAYATALWELCSLILQEDETTVSQAKDKSEGKSLLRANVREAVLESVGGSWKVLSFVFENIKQIMEDDDGRESLSSVDSSPSVDVNMTREDFHYIVTMFLKAVSKALGKERPLILFLDDLQWMDIPSLELTHTLISNSESNSVFFVFAFRNNEVSESHPLWDHIHKWEQKSDGRTSGPAVSLTEINVGDLGLEAIVDLVSDSLGVSEDRALDLAKTVIARTKGNAFFSIQYLRMLEEEGLLTHSKGTGGGTNCKDGAWHWDDKAIAARTDLAGNDVMELIIYRIQRLRSEAQDVLCLASCFGSQFDATMIDLLASDAEEEGENFKAETCSNGNGDAPESKRRAVAALQLDRSALRSNFQVLVREGLIVQQLGGGGGDPYRFSHDRIQQVAYSLVPPNDADLWHLCIGERLWARSSSKQLHTHLFVVVDQINRGAALINDDIGKVAVARLNAKAGKKAMSSSAFIPAASYFRAGVDLLRSNEDKWTTNYDFCLSIYGLYAEACSCNGNFDLMESLLGEIFEHGRSLDDKLKGYVTLVDSLAARDRLEEAIVTGFDILGDLGQPIPRVITKRLIITELLKTKLALRGKNVDALGPMTDEAKRRTMAIFATLFTYVYLAKVEYIPILVFKMIRLTVKHGIHDTSAYAFTAYAAIICGAIGNYKQGYEYGQIGLRLLERSRNTVWFTRIYTGLSVINHWAQPLRSFLPSLLNAYSVGMRNGETQNATMAAHVYCLQSYHCGCPLPELEVKMRSFYNVMAAHGQQVNMVLHEPLWQSVLNLMGQSADPLVLDGEVMTQSANIQRAKEKGDRLEVSNIYFWRLILAGLFGKHELAMEMAEKSSLIVIKVLSGYANTRYAFFQGLSAIAMARQATASKLKARWKKLAKNNITKLTRYDRLKSGNREYMILLLKAEYAAMGGKQRNAMQAYDAAIKLAKENDFLQDEGLCCEKTALFLISHKRMDEAKQYMHRAVSCYSSWGACAKVNQLKLLYPSLLQTYVDNRMR